MEDIKKNIAELLDLEQDDLRGDTETGFDVCDDTMVVAHGKQPGIVVVGYLSYDPDSGDYWNDSDNLGSLKIFRSQADRDAYTEELDAEGKISFVVDKYSHGNVHYSVHQSRAYPDRQWDVAPSGVYVPCEDVQKDFKDNVAKAKQSHDYSESTRSSLMATLIPDSNVILDEYSKWSNGDFFGVVAEVYSVDKESGRINRIDSDECWGLIGMDYASQELGSKMEEISVVLVPADLPAGP